MLLGVRSSLIWLFQIPFGQLMKKSYSDKKISIEIKHLNVVLWPGQMAELSNSAPINGSIGGDVTPDVKELPLLRVLHFTITK